MSKLCVEVARRPEEPARPAGALAGRAASANAQISTSADRLAVFVPQPLARPAARLAGRACLEPLARPLDIRRAGLGPPHQPGPEGRDKADRAIGK